jgi:hypothetical protein
MCMWTCLAPEASSRLALEGLWAPAQSRTHISVQHGETRNNRYSKPLNDLKLTSSAGFSSRGAFVKSSQEATEPPSRAWFASSAPEPVTDGSVALLPPLSSIIDTESASPPPMCVLELAPDATEAFAVVPLSVAVASFFATAVQALLSGIGAGFIIVCIMATYLANRNVCAGDSEHVQLETLQAIECTPGLEARLLLPSTAFLPVVVQPWSAEQRSC